MNVAKTYRKQTHFPVLFAALLLGLGSCSSSSSAVPDSSLAAPDDASSETLGAQDYCESISGFFCDFYLRCGRIAVDTKEECLPAFIQSCHAGIERQFVDLEGAGLLSFAPQEIESCKQHLDAVECVQQRYELGGPCAALWTGKVTQGGACGLDSEFFVCDPSSECVLAIDFCGTCRALVPLGQTCQPGVDTCGQVAFCAGEEAAQRCVARKKNGEACAEMDRCQIGSACRSGICQSPIFVGLGDACDSDNRCPYMSSCIAGSCQASALQGHECGTTTACASGTCVGGICIGPKEDGSVCTSPNQCLSGRCLDGSCAARPSACFDGS